MRVGVRRLVVGGVAACACALAAAQAAPAVTTTPRIVGGAVVPIAQAPWQVAIVKKNLVTPTSAAGAQFCGGVVLDATHVVTAAHCLDLNGDNVVDATANRQVIAGAGDLGTLGGLVPVDVATWGGMPGYFTSTTGADDVAVAQLATPLDFTSTAVKPAVLAASADRTPPGAPLVVSGYGLTMTNGQPSPQLRATDLFAVDDPTCDGWYAPDFDRPSMLCAIAPGRDSCNGDSGGPLTRPDGTLVGLVSSGPQDCASADGAPGIYAELADPDIAAYIRAFDPGPAYAPPIPNTPPKLTGKASSGESLTCEPGSWLSGATGTPEIDVRFATTTGATLRGWSSDRTYVVGNGDGGLRVVCVERARDATGASVATSAASDPVVGPPASTPPPAPQPAPQPVAPKDTTAPQGSFISIRCVHGRCVVRVRAFDPGSPASGVRAVRVTALPARGRTRTLSARRIATGVYEVRFTRLARGACWFTLATSDVAGNGAPEPAIRRVRVR